MGRAGTEAGPGSRVASHPRPALGFRPRLLHQKHCLQKACLWQGVCESPPARAYRGPFGRNVLPQISPSGLLAPPSRALALALVLSPASEWHLACPEGFELFCNLWAPGWGTPCSHQAAVLCHIRTQPRRGSCSHTSELGRPRYGELKSLPHPWSNGELGGSQTSQWQCGPHGEHWADPTPVRCPGGKSLTAGSVWAAG